MEKTNKTVDFIGIGVQKSATTWIFNNLLDHPEICGPEMKETGFFMNKYSSPFQAGKRKITDFAEKRDIKDYEKLYSHCGDKVKGEFTPGYLFYPEATRLIKENYPEAKLIVCLRNPIDRAFSHYLNEYYRLKLDMPFEEASLVDDEILRRGLYSEQLKRLFEIFPKEQVFVGFYEDIFKDAKGFIQDVYAFLGVDRDHLPSLAGSILNRRKDGLRSWARVLHMFVTPILRKIGLGRFIKNSPRLRSLFNKIAKKEKTTMKLSKKERSSLFDYYKEDIRKTSELLGRDLSNWK